VEDDPDEECDGDAQRQDHHVGACGSRPQQFEEERKQQVELEEHDDDVQLVVAGTYVAPEVGLRLIPLSAGRRMVNTT